MNVDELMQLSDGPLIAVIALAAVQIALLVIALIVLVRTPQQRIQHLSKGLWVLMILLVNIIGPLVFLTIGRERQIKARPSAAMDQPAPNGYQVRDPAGQAFVDRYEQQ